MAFNMKDANAALKCASKYVMFCALLFVSSNALYAQRKIELNLVDMELKGMLTKDNRDLSVQEENGNKFLKIQHKLTQGQVPGRGDQGNVWLPVREFSEGVIEIHARGKDIVQGSFVGVAFHAINDSTFDDVYARPFNFIAVDSVRRIHAVQYTFPPKYDWQKLRTEQNGKYEKGIENASGPNEWFTMKVEVGSDSVKTYFNGSTKPSLVVKKLNTNRKGKVGLTGFNYDIDKMTIYYKD